MIPMIMVDESGRFQRINRAFKEVTGYEDSDILGRTLGDNTHPADHDEVDVVRRGLQSGSAFSDVAEKKIIRKDGSVMRSGEFDRGQQIGIWKTFDREGKVVKETDFSKKS